MRVTVLTAIIEVLMPMSVMARDDSALMNRSRPGGVTVTFIREAR